MQWGNDGNMPNRNGSDRIIFWLTGYGPIDLETILEDGALSSLYAESEKTVL